jgi:hypothetical protein
VRIPFLPRPSRRDLASRPLHVLVRDYPETLADLRDYGIAPEAFGDLSIEELEDRDFILDALEEATAWRPGVGIA